MIPVWMFSIHLWFAKSPHWTLLRFRYCSKPLWVFSSSQWWLSSSYLHTWESCWKPGSWDKTEFPWTKPCTRCCCTASSCCCPCWPSPAPSLKPSSCCTPTGCRRTSRFLITSVSSSYHGFSARLSMDSEIRLLEATLAKHFSAAQTESGLVSDANSVTECLLFKQSLTFFWQLGQGNVKNSKLKCHAFEGVVHAASHALQQWHHTSGLANPWLPSVMRLFN